MATAPDRVRRALLRVTGAAKREVRAVVEQAPQEPSALRASLFAAAPLILNEYAPASATLATDWFEEIREEADVRRVFTPTPRLRVTDDLVSAKVASATSALRDIESRLTVDLDALTAEMMRDVEGEMEKLVATGFWDTITENSQDDPDSVGWRRFARPGACKFCLMLAARGAVYTESTARFAAHGAVMRDGRKGGNCMCIAGPAYATEADLVEATPIQYLASRRRRTAADRARLREYLNENFPDAPG